MGGWRCYYRIADCALAIEGTDPTLMRWAESLYPCVQCAALEPQRVFCLERARGGYALSEAGNELIVAADWAELFAAAEWRLTRALMQGLTAFYQLHAGVVVMNGHALVLCGSSGAGKTSLAIGLGLRGGAIYGDEVALFESDSERVVAFPRDLIARNATVALFPELGELALPAWKVFSEHRHVPARGWCGTAGLPVPCAGFVFPRLDFASREPRLRRLGPAEAAQRVLEQSFNISAWGAKAIDFAGKLAESLPAWELVFANARRAADCVLDSEIEW
jgi:hypothetical protein